MSNLENERNGLDADYNIADLLRTYQIIDDGQADRRRTSGKGLPGADSVSEGQLVEQGEQTLLALESVESLDDNQAAGHRTADSQMTLLEPPFSLWGIERKSPTDDKLADFWSPWLLLLVGILGGSILTLLILQGLNGTLAFTDTTEVDRLQLQLAALEQELANQNDDVATTLTILESQINALEQTRISETEDGIVQLQAALNNIKGQAEALSTQVGSLETTMSDLAMMSEGTSAKTSEANSDIESLRNEISTVQAKIDTLQTNNESVQGTLQTLQENVAQYQTLFARLREFLLSIEEPAIEEPAGIVDSEN